jgi:hypothetical protein
MDDQCGSNYRLLQLAIGNLENHHISIGRVRSPASIGLSRRTTLEKLVLASSSQGVLSNLLISLRQFESYHRVFRAMP